MSLYVFENDGKFHVRTCSDLARKTGQNELGHRTALEAEHSKPQGAGQIELRLCKHAFVGRRTALTRGANKPTDTRVPRLAEKTLAPDELCAGGEQPAQSSMR